MPTTSSFRAELGGSLASLETYLQQFFLENAERYDYGSLFEPIYQDMGEFVSRRGKRIRPALLLLAYRIFGGTRSSTDIHLLKNAVALELLHAFILIHDDVIDRSELRRGLPTFHKLVEQRMGKLPGRERIGQNVAMVAGDMLFALAIDTLQATDFPFEVREKALRHFLRYVTDTGCGEIYDILLGARDIARVKEEDIARMYTLKTTRYTFEAPIVLGGILAEAPAEAVESVAAVMEPLGLAFQIQNDLIEYSHFDLADRAMQSDLLEGKKTLLIREAYERLQDLDRSFLQLCLSAPTHNESSITKVKELMDKSGAVAALRQRMQDLFATAEDLLDKASLTSLQRDGVREGIELVRQQTQQTGTN